MAKVKLAYLGYRLDWEVDRLKSAAGDEVEVVAVPRESDRETFEAAAADAEVVVPWGRVFDLDMARRCKRLRLVQALSAGTDYLPVNELAEMGVRVANNHGGNAVAVAEMAVVLMVGAYRQLATQWRQTYYEGAYNNGFFDRWETFHELTGKRVGIIGLGQIGSRVAKRLQGWECEVVYHDIAQIDSAVEQASGASRVGREELLETSDIVSLHVPLNRVTRGMISDRELELMKPSAILVNTCRGPVVDEAALIRALEEKRIAGAGLDVTELEPIPDGNPLLKLDNAVVTPHLAGLTIEAREKSLDFAVENALRVARSEDPEAIVLPV